MTAIALIVAACGSSGLTPFKWDFDIPGYGLWSSLKTIHFNDLCLNIASIPMVAAGMGWSIVPESFRRILPNDVAYVRIDDDMPKAIIGLAHRRDDRSAAVRNFVACARRQSRGLFAPEVLVRH